MNKLLTVFAGLVFLATVVGCETTRGAGKDMEKAGESIQKTVEHND